MKISASQQLDEPAKGVSLKWGRGDIEWVDGRGYEWGAFFAISRHDEDGRCILEGGVLCLY